MDVIEEALEKAKESGDDHEFNSALHTLRRQIDGEVYNELVYNIALLDSTNANHPYLDALRGYRKWTHDNNYDDGAEPALENYAEGIRSAIDQEWYNTASWSIAAYLELADELNHTSRIFYWCL